MSQEEVFSWLAAHPGWHRTAEIKKGIGKEASSIRGSLVALEKHGEIKMRLLGKSSKAGLEWSV
jgi:DNA-binding IclR family transcriptional regulator